jgi:DNA-binding MarR family transcriptional regulator
MSANPKYIEEPLSKERLRLWIKLIKTHGAIESELRLRFRGEFDTTLPRFDVLSTLSRAPKGLKMSEISGLLNVSNSNVTGIVDRLTDSGLVIRTAVENDRRTQLVRMTKAGEKAFSEMAAAHEEWLDELIGSLNIRKLRGFHNLLEDMTNHLEYTGANTDA